MNLTSAHQVWSKFAQETMSDSLIKRAWLGTVSCMARLKQDYPMLWYFTNFPKKHITMVNQDWHIPSTCVPFPWSPGPQHAHLLPALAHSPQQHLQERLSSTKRRQCWRAQLQRRRRSYCHITGWLITANQQMFPKPYFNDDYLKDHSKTFSLCLVRKHCKDILKSYLKLTNLPGLQLLQPTKVLRWLVTLWLERKAKLASHCFSLYYTELPSMLADTV